MLGGASFRAGLWHTLLALQATCCVKAADQLWDLAAKQEAIAGLSSAHGR